MDPNTGEKKYVFRWKYLEIKIFLYVCWISYLLK